MIQRRDKSAIGREEKILHTIQKCGTIDHDSYKITRNRVNEEIRRIKHQFWEKFSTDMEHDLYRGQKKIWNTLRNRRRAVNEYIQITTITTEKWEEYFRNLYGNMQLTSQQTVGAPNAICTPLDSWQISKDSIETTIHKLKNRKSPGPDNIANELLKYGGSALLEENYILYSVKF